MSIVFLFNTGQHASYVRDAARGEPRQEQSLLQDASKFKIIALNNVSELQVNFKFLLLTYYCRMRIRIKLNNGIWINMTAAWILNTTIQYHVYKSKANKKLETSRLPHNEVVSPPPPFLSWIH